MHVRPSPSGSDDDLLTSMSSSPSIAGTDITSPTLSHDDNFHEGPDNDSLDDVWGSEPSSPTTVLASAHNHPSDIPRLRAEHATAGYRDGLTAAKAASVQAGFDEGFGLGATLGLHAGRLIGLLEGLAECLDGEDGVRVTKLHHEARAELRLLSVFAPEHWETDGTWRYEVAGEDTVFADVAAAHPAVKRWEDVVRKEMERWGVNEKILSGESEGEGRTGEVSRPEVEKKAVKAAPKEREALAW